MTFELPPDLRDQVDRQAREAEAERGKQQRQERAKRLCGLAAWVVETLRSPPSAKIAADVEAAIHSVGAGVEALATYELAVRQGRQRTPAENAAARDALSRIEVERALEQAWRAAHEPRQNPGRRGS